jgi:ribosomal protein L17
MFNVELTKRMQRTENCGKGTQQVEHTINMVPMVTRDLITHFKMETRNKKMQKMRRKMTRLMEFGWPV